VSSKHQVTRNTPLADLPELLTPVEVAAYLGLNPWTVYSAIRTGDVPCRRFGPKRIFIHKSFLTLVEAVQQPQGV
jgi:hypothetical protein